MTKHIELGRAWRAHGVVTVGLVLAVLSSGCTDSGTEEIVRSRYAVDHTATSITMFPTRLVDRRGDSDIEDIAVLERAVLSGTEDDWHEYVELSPGSRGYRGVLHFALPEGIARDSVVGMRVEVAYRGPVRDDMRWSFSLRNFEGRGWRTLGDNSGLEDWVWSRLSFAVDSPLQFIKSNGIIRLRCDGRGDFDVSQIDYVGVVLQLDEPAPAPEAEPGPSPTPDASPDAGAEPDAGPALDAAPEPAPLPTPPTPDDGVRRMTLEDVRTWAYNIQDVHTARQREQLVGSHFDMYVLEVVTTERGMESFDIAGLVQDIRDHNITTRGVDPLVLAYVDVGEAENWRWYFDRSWSVGDPDWIVTSDPNGWDGNYPVAFWRPEWQNIAIYGDGTGRSLVEETLVTGFDGIYMDWVEAFSDTDVVNRVAAEFGLSGAAAEGRSAELMLDFIENIGRYARVGSPHADPSYIVVSQNASDLHGWNPARYEALVDGIALEAIWYDGDGGFDDWSDPAGYNVRTNDLYRGWTEEVLGHLAPLTGRMPIFCVEYAQDVGGVTLGTDAYALAAARGFIGSVSRRSLAQLSTTPYPPGYGPADY